MLHCFQIYTVQFKWRQVWSCITLLGLTARRELTMVSSIGTQCCMLPISPLRPSTHNIYCLMWTGTFRLISRHCYRNINDSYPPYICSFKTRQLPMFIDRNAHHDHIARRSFALRIPHMDHNPVLYTHPPRTPSSKYQIPFQYQLDYARIYFRKRSPAPLRACRVLSIWSSPRWSSWAASSQSTSSISS